jgi:hypothetical protein
MFVDRFTRIDAFLLVGMLIAAASVLQLHVQDVMLMVMAVRDAAGGCLSMLTGFVDSVIRD